MLEICFGTKEKMNIVSIKKHNINLFKLKFLCFNLNKVFNIWFMGSDIYNIYIYTFLIFLIYVHVYSVIYLKINEDVWVFILKRWKHRCWFLASFFNSAIRQAVGYKWKQKLQEKRLVPETNE